MAANRQVMPRIELVCMALEELTREELIAYSAVAGYMIAKLSLHIGAPNALEAAIPTDWPDGLSQKGQELSHRLAQRVNQLAAEMN